MTRCECSTAKGKRCKLAASKKLDDDQTFCWRHQNCTQITQSSRPQRKTNPKKTPKKTVKKTVKKSRRRGKKIAKEEGKEFNWCNTNDIVRSNIIKNLSREDINNVCLTSKICRDKVCKRSQLWTGLIKEQYGKTVDKDEKAENLRAYYYRLGTDARMFQVDDILIGYYVDLSPRYYKVIKVSPKTLEIQRLYVKDSGIKDKFGNTIWAPSGKLYPTKNRAKIIDENTASLYQMPLKKFSNIEKEFSS